MLILSRRFRQSVVIGGRVKVTVVAIEANHVELGIQAPQHIAVDREEIHLRKRHATRLGCRARYVQERRRST